MQFFQVGKILCFCRNGNDQSINGGRSKVFQVHQFTFSRFHALGDDDIVSMFVGNGVNAIDDLRKEAVGYFTYNHTDGKTFSLL